MSRLAKPAVGVGAALDFILFRGCSSYGMDSNGKLVE